MRRVERVPKPQVLADHEAQWLADLLAAQTRMQLKKAESRYRHPQIKSALESMFLGKCAYCESAVTHVGYPHIEHFVPRKGPVGDMAKTFDWTNLLLACGKCNGPEYKSDRFPCAAEGGPLLDPCSDDPYVHLEFIYDQVAQLASVYGTTGRGIVSERVLGLNRPELREYRSRYVRKILVLERLAPMHTDAAALLAEARTDRAPYVAFVRALIGL
jgi:uncharacterized protein (TIGR02646 family)